MINKTFVTKIEGQSIDFYLVHKDIGLPAKMFYRGQYALYDDEETFGFLDSLLTKNTETRPFYFFVFNQAMKVTDGALSEYMANICLRYLETMPCEFLRNIFQNVSKADRNTWTSFIGWQIYDKKTFDKIMMAVGKNVSTNCSSQKQAWDKLKPEIENGLEVK
ncbi:MAG: hypothetical protein JNM78_03070 [Cyclobacteriaceae bacterium]|nr:hypothetical protein [Cyclobacteriaceae bacterium]